MSVSQRLSFVCLRACVSVCLCLFVVVACESALPFTFGRASFRAWVTIISPPPLPTQDPVTAEAERLLREAEWAISGIGALS